MTGHVGKEVYATRTRLTVNQENGVLIGLGQCSVVAQGPWVVRRVDGLASDVRNRGGIVGQAGCSPLHEDLGVLGSCEVLWVKRSGVSGVGVLSGSWGVELCFILANWV
jgi:hypothetical protein